MGIRIYESSFEFVIVLINVHLLHYLLTSRDIK